MEKIWLLFAVNLGICAWGMRISSSPSMGVLAKSALNPVLIVWVFRLCCSVLYLISAGDEYVYHPRLVFYASTEDQVFSYLIFTIFSLFLAMGNALAERTARPAVATGFAPSRGLSAGPLFLISLSISASVVVYLVGAFGVRSFADLQTLTANRFVAYRESSLIIYMFMLPFLAFSAYCSKSRMRFRFLLCLTLTLMASLASGNRINIMAVGFAVGAALTFRGWHFPRLLWLAFPVLGPASAYSLYYLRGFKAYASVGEQVQQMGGWLDLITNPFEFHYHLSLTSIVTMALDEKIDRIPGEAIWAAVWLPVPRFIMPFKGESPSAAFSEVINPEIWYRFASQATLGLFGDVYLEFGLSFGCIIVLLVGFVWFRISMPQSRRAIEVQVLFTTGLLAATVLFVRSGTTQMAQIFWSCLALYMMMQGLRQILVQKSGGSGRKPSRLPQNAIS